MRIVFPISLSLRVNTDQRYTDLYGILRPLNYDISIADDRNICALAVSRTLTSAGGWNPRKEHRSARFTGEESRRRRGRKISAWLELYGGACHIYGTPD